MIPQTVEWYWDQQYQFIKHPVLFWEKYISCLWWWNLNQIDPISAEFLQKICPFKNDMFSRSTLVFANWKTRPLELLLENGFKWEQFLPLNAICLLPLSPFFLLADSVFFKMHFFFRSLFSYFWLTVSNSRGSRASLQNRQIAIVMKYLNSGFWGCDENKT